jgi:hypothetical protein
VHEIVRYLQWRGHSVSAPRAHVRGRAVRAARSRMHGPSSREIDGCRGARWPPHARGTCGGGRLQRTQGKLLAAVEYCRAYVTVSSLQTCRITGRSYCRCGVFSAGSGRPSRLWLRKAERCSADALEPNAMFEFETSLARRVVPCNNLRIPRLKPRNRHALR